MVMLLLVPRSATLPHSVLVKQTRKVHGALGHNRLLQAQESLLIFLGYRTIRGGLAESFSEHGQKLPPLRPRHAARAEEPHDLANGRVQSRKARCVYDSRSVSQLLREFPRVLSFSSSNETRVLEGLESSRHRHLHRLLYQFLGRQRHHPHRHRRQQ